MSKGRVLITGGAGFIGSHLTDYLLQRGFEVAVLDSLIEQVHGDIPKGADGWPSYLNPKADRFRGDAGDPDALNGALEGVTHFVHLAASVGVGQSMADINFYTQNNTGVAGSVLQVLSERRQQIKRIAVASSMSVYGEGEYRNPTTGKQETPTLRERRQLMERRWEIEMDNVRLEPVPTRESKPLLPASIYAVNKLDHELMFLVMGKTWDIPTVAMRIFNTYGSRQALSNPYTGVAAIFMSRLMNDQPPQAFEDGQQLRDFIHVHDVARAFGTVLESNKQVCDMYNLGTGRPITVTYIAETLANLMRKDIAPKVLSQYRVGDIRHCYADPSKLEKDFGFRAEIEFKEGAQELYRWISGQPAIDRTDQSMDELQRHRLVV